MSLIDSLKGAVDDVLEKGRTAVGENAGRINTAIDTVTAQADARTAGRYGDRIAKAAETAKQGVSVLASEPGAAGTAAAGRSSADEGAKAGNPSDRPAAG